MHQIEHIVVLMMENHSFDNLLGMVPHQVRGRQNVDGLTVRRGRVTNVNPGPRGRVRAHRASSPCQEHGIPTQAWNASHIAYDGGRNDGFVRASGPVAMWFWDQRDLPFTYSLAQHFPIGERYFCSTLCQTYPNRRFFFSGTASGLIATNLPQTLKIPAANGTIWDRLDAHHIDYAVYYQDLPSWAIIPGTVSKPGRGARQHKFDQFYGDVAAGKLPAFTFLDPNYGTTSEENPQDIQVGEQFIAKVVRALMHAPTWKHTALFITYDEHGGYYDHVPPLPAIKPDNIKPILSPGDRPGGYDRYGFRVPMIVVSPCARARYVSNRGAGPHLDDRLHRAQVESAGDDVPRRQRRPDDRLLRLPPPHLREAPQARRGSPARPRPGPVPRPGPEPATPDDAPRRRGGPRPAAELAAARAARTAGPSRLPPRAARA